MKVKIIDMDHSGLGIAKIDNKVCFIPKCIPGDIVDITITKEHKNYLNAKINNYLEKSNNHISNICPYYNECGGCNISNLEYSNQLQYKKHKVENILKKYLNLDLNIDIIESNMIYKYRNKITYTIKKNIFGLYSIDNDVISINRCLLVSEKINDLSTKISKLDLSKLNKITILETNNGLLLDINGYIDINSFKYDTLGITMNNELVYGTNYDYININKLKYRVSNKSFFQINTTNISKLYDQILKYGSLSLKDNVVDLYCGVGSISLYISKYVKSVLGIEIIPEAIEDAKENAKLNNITNCNFICSDVSKIIEDNLSCDKLIVDPPRIGMDKHTVECLNSSKINKIIYVSCDSMTMVRDLKNLTNYTITNIVAVDMFPQTHHVETVCVLERS